MDATADKGNRIEPGAGDRRPRTIVVFSDGTGNSSGKLFKTNVWRLYDALDLTQLTDGQRAQGIVQQVAYYDDGVGTSGFKPLAVLGGVFGVGLQRNVLDLYTFLCRNYREGDEIYAFGFSRGAFTIRVLIGLVVTQGLLTCKSEEQLGRYALDAYRANRRRFNAKGFIQPFVTALRDLRDALIGGWRRRQGQPLYRDVERIHPKEIAFVGVWDTVAAYGLPIAELTRGIDKWIWPLSMPNYTLSDKVRRARHALTLDDERDTFHPLLWDEPEDGTDPGDRLQQVWFCGMHSDVGGGYPDDSLAYVSLDWMLAQLKPTGLRFRPDKVEEFAQAWNRFGPMHDSRSGFAAYYRYQPRKLAARFHPPDPTTLIMRDPELSRGQLTKVKIHESVLDRIRSGTDHYAPIVLPSAYEVVDNAGSPVSSVVVERNPTERANRQEWVWNDVWRRRITYFSTVGVSLLLAALPLYQCWVPSWIDIDPGKLFFWALKLAGLVLPGFVGWWLEAFARTPIVFGLLVLAIAGLLMTSARLQTRIQDGMHGLWKWALGQADAPSTPSGQANGRPNDWVYALRTSERYQKTLQLVKWEIAPGLFGILVLILGMLGIGWIGKSWPILWPFIVVGFLFLALRAALARAEMSKRFCPGEVTEPVVGSSTATDLFTTDSVCWSPGWEVAKGSRYRVSFVVGQDWMDRTIPATPEGFGSRHMPWYARLFVLLRRSIIDEWFQPMIKIVPVTGSDDAVHTGALQVKRVAERRYEGTFQAPVAGALALFVNDAMIPWGGLSRLFYDNNRGDAEVTITRLEPPGADS